MTFRQDGRAEGIMSPMHVCAYVRVCLCVRGCVCGLVAHMCDRFVHLPSIHSLKKLCILDSDRKVVRV